MKQYYIYIMGNKKRNKFSIDVTDNLVGALCSSEESSGPAVRKVNPGLNLIYFEQVENIFNAVQLKMQYEKWNKTLKMLLVEKFNPEWKDLFLELLFQNENTVKLSLQK